eukprot:72125-Rhodomonas_salina.5
MAEEELWGRCCAGAGRVYLSGGRERKQAKVDGWAAVMVAGEVFHFWRGPVQAGRDPRGVGGPSQRPIHLELPLLPLLAAGPRRRDAGKHPPRGARESAQGHARLLPFWHLCSHPAPGPQRPNGPLIP